ncbi:MAG: hypothetical protein SFU27_03070 [Thermonemataceae bacterium]|nr:hypothetical protein [Thermonemataceae bacterium]
MSKYFLFLLFYGFSACLFAQERKEIILETDTIPDLSIKLPKEKKDVRKAKVKKNVFYDRKTKKTFIRSGAVTEVFHYLKVNEKTNKYVEQIYTYSKKNKKIYVSNYQKLKLGENKLLHGPYVKKRDDKIIEEGFFYLGLKHGRWEQYGSDAMDRDFVLIDKVKYNKGFFKESKVEYYDPQQTKLKEVIPIRDGKENGTYYFYHSNESVAIKGDYENGVKIGTWIEYYKNGRKKKETFYPKRWFDTTEVKSYEYTEKGARIDEDKK